MKPLKFFAAFVLFVSLAASCEAHFVWVGVAPAKDGKPAAHVVFSETPEADNAELIPKIADTKLSIAKPSGPLAAIELKQETADGDGALVGEIKAVAPYRLQAYCDYGVFSRGDQTMLLQYYAKHLHVTSPAQLANISLAKELALDVVPAVSGDELRFQVTFRGKPVNESQVVLIGPDGKGLELSTDSSGCCTAKLQAGDYAVRARWTEDRAGERDGKSFKQVRHYCTLTLAMPSAPAAASR